MHNRTLIQVDFRRFSRIKRNACYIIRCPIGNIDIAKSRTTIHVTADSGTACIAIGACCFGFFADIYLDVTLHQCVLAQTATMNVSVLKVYAASCSGNTTTNHVHCGIPLRNTIDITTAKHATSNRGISRRCCSTNSHRCITINLCSNIRRGS